MRRWTADLEILPASAAATARTDRPRERSRRASPSSASESILLTPIPIYVLGWDIRRGRAGQELSAPGLTTAPPARVFLVKFRAGGSKTGEASKGLANRLVGVPAET